MNPKKKMMRLLARGLLTSPVLVLILAVGCSSAKPKPLEMRVPAPETRQAPLPFDVTIRLDGCDALVIHSLSARIDNTTIPYHLSAGTPATQAANDRRATYVLIPDHGRGPTLRCTIAYNDLRTQATLTVSATQPLPEILLRATTPTLLMPARLEASGDPRVVRAAMGPPIGGEFMPPFGPLQALFDPEQNRALVIDGRTGYLPEENGGTLTASAAGSTTKTQTILTLTSRPNVLTIPQAASPLRVADMLNPVISPAGWCVPAGAPQRGDEELGRDLRWMAVNLEPYGARNVFVGRGRSSETAMTSPDALQPSQALRDLIQRFGFSLVTRVRDTTADAMVPYPRLDSPLHDIQLPGPIRVGEPFTRDRAQLLATLVGLGGQSVIMADALHTLTAERTEILRRILPPAPIRMIDLFEHDLPNAWNLNIVKESDGMFDQWNILGLFNWSDQPETRMVRLTEVGIHPGRSTKFAVFDVWQQRLLALADDRFDINVPPTACRLLCIRRLEPDRPTLIGTNRHITQGGIDLHDVQWKSDALTFCGHSDVIADDPYDLCFIVPEGDDSFEIADLQTDVRLGADATRIRCDGPLRIVTFDSSVNRRIRWAILFERAPSPTTPRPSVPTQLRAKQNTRGVRLAWDRRDDRAVLYRVYRDGKMVAHVEDHTYQDSDALYGQPYTYYVTGVDGLGRESPPSDTITHQTPLPASTNLTQLVPLSATQGHLRLGKDRNAEGKALRIAGQRFYRGLGTHAPSRVRYFLGGGYRRFSGAVGIDDVVGAGGSAVFKIVADGQNLFTSKTMQGGKRAQRFAVPITGKKHLELIVEDAGDGADRDHADWGNPYLSAAGIPTRSSGKQK